jgi:hypothetical protein
MFGNLLLATLPSQVLVSIRGVNLLSACAFEWDLNCMILDTIGSELIVKFTPITSIKHIILVSRESAVNLSF